MIFTRLWFWLLVIGIYFYVKYNGVTIGSVTIGGKD